MSAATTPGPPPDDQPPCPPGVGRPPHPSIGGASADPPSPADAAAVLQEAQAIVDGAATCALRLAGRRRRALRALHDLGLLAVVGRAWVSVGDEGLSFASLDGRASDALVTALETLAARKDGGAYGHLRALGDAPRAMGAPYSVN